MHANRATSRSCVRLQSCARFRVPKVASDDPEPSASSLGLLVCRLQMAVSIPVQLGILSHSQRTQGYMTFQDLAGSRISYARTVRPTPCGAMNPLNDVVAD